MGAAVHRPATLDDAPRLFEVRRRSILELAPSGMPVEDAEAWARKLTPAGMGQKLREFEIWIAELEDVIAGWGAIHRDVLEGLYTAPEYAGQGVGAALLDRLEALMALIPWPEPHMSFHALVPVVACSKSIFDGSASGNLSGSRPAAEIEGFR